jgi:excisionase family DNA binding protein
MSKMERDHVDRLLSVDEVATLLRVPTATLYRWRSRGVGPPSAKIGRYLRYVERDVDNWVASRRDQGPEDPRASS